MEGLLKGVFVGLESGVGYPHHILVVLGLDLRCYEFHIVTRLTW